MDRQLRVAFIASESVPFAKTGGLADVVGALPDALLKAGHEPVVILPKYAGLKTGGCRLMRLFESMGVWMGNSQEWCAVDYTLYRGVPVYFIEFDRYFQRDGLYNDREFNDFTDNAYRFSFFTRAALQLLIDLRQPVDIVHCHDWQTALAPAYLKIWHWNHSVLGTAASVLTVHNIAYQGVFSAECFDYTGLQWQNFTPEKFEDHGRVNFLKAGIHYADMVTTVSPRYAIETRSPEYAHGMAPYLNDRGDSYTGILNGVDYDVWNPQRDPLIPAHYSWDDLSGKTLCKRALQERMGLTIDDNVMLMGVVSRFASQKGLHLLGEALPSILENMNVQCVVLGSGEPGLESLYGNLPARYPGRVGSYIGYNNELAHWIEAGCDAFIMPSLYEPCGLNQIYSLRYGTLPVVRATGGLDDTVEQYCELTGEGTGFKFDEASTHAVYYAIGWAVSTYYDRPEHFHTMQIRAMQVDLSWANSAEHYADVYRKALNRKP